MLESVDTLGGTPNAWPGRDPRHTFCRQQSVSWSSAWLGAWNNKSRRCKAVTHVGMKRWVSSMLWGRRPDEGEEIVLKWWVDAAKVLYGLKRASSGCKPSVCLYIWHRPRRPDGAWGVSAASNHYWPIRYNQNSLKQGKPHVQYHYYCNMICNFQPDLYIKQ